MRVALGLVGVTTKQTPGTNESLTTIEYFHLKVAFLASGELSPRAYC